MAKLFKLLQRVFNILFYVSAFFILLSLILSLILVFINVDVDEMLLPPFMNKIEDETGHAASYEISFGNGIKVGVNSSDIDLDDIKAALFAGIFVVIFTLLTVAPIFKFLDLLLKNINNKNLFDAKNPRYVMYIGLCVFIGNMAIRFVMRFYNYYLAVRFIKEAAEKIHLSLGIDILSGITGLAILLIGFIFSYIFQCRVAESTETKY